MECPSVLSYFFSEVSPKQWIPGQIFGLILSFVSNRCFQVVLDGKHSQKYPVNAGVPQGLILCPTPFLLFINDLLMFSVILLSMLMILSTQCDQASDLWQQLEMAAELESNLRGTVNWGKWLVNFNARKTQLVLFDWSNNTGAIDVKINGSVLLMLCLGWWCS